MSTDFMLRNREVLAVFCISLISFVIFSNSLYGDFVYDDSRAIKSNYDLRPTTPWFDLFKHDFWGVPITHSGSHKSYRPLTVLTYRINYYISGINSTFSYHLFNSLLHILVCGLLYQLLQYTQLDFISRVLSTLLFAVHPIHTEAVSGLTGRAELIATVFLLLAVTNYHVNSNSKYTVISTVILSFMSMLSKEQGITAILLCGVLEFRHFVRLRLNNEYTSASIGRCCLLIFSSILLMSFRCFIMEMTSPTFSPSDNPTAHSSSFVTRLSTFAYLPLFNAFLLIYPSTLSFDWSMDAIKPVESIFDYRFLFTVSFYLILTAIALKLSKTLLSEWEPKEIKSRTPSPCFRKRTPSPKFDMNGNFLISNNNNSNIISNCNSCNEQNGYLSTTSEVNNNIKHNFYYNPPVNGYKSKFKASSLDLHKISSEDTVISQKLTISETTIFSCAIMVITFLPATNLLFYVGFVVAERVLYLPSIGYCILIGIGYQKLSKVLKNKIILDGLMVILLLTFASKTFVRNSDWNSEERLYKSGTKINPAKAYSNLGNVYSSQGKKDLAEFAYKSALNHRPNMADTLFNLGTMFQGENRLQEAEKMYRLAIKSRPQLAAAHLNLGLTLWSMNKLNQAETVFTTCELLSSKGLKDPKSHLHSRISCVYNLGRLLAQSGGHKIAIHTYNRALHMLDSHYPTKASLYNVLGDCHMNLGHMKSAKEWFIKALNVKNDHIPAHLTLSNWFLKMGQNSDAENMLEKALFLAPEDPGVHLHLGRYYLDANQVSKGLKYLKTASLATKDNFEVEFSLANAFRLNGDFIFAEKLYEKCVRLRNSDAVARTNYGAILHANNKLKLAEVQYLQAIKLNPNDEITKMNLVKLRRIFNK